MGQYLIRNGRAQCTVETVENCRAGARAESSTVALNEATAAYAIGRLHATAYQTSRAAGDHGAQKNMRISRGRTIREFLMGVLLVPTAFTLLWMTVFGNTAIHMILTDGITDLATAIDKDTSLALFAFLQHFPFASVISMVAIIMVVVFFVTSADSGAMVVDMLASGGQANTPIKQRVFWAASMGAVAIALLLAGGLKSLQTATIASALPFTILLFSMRGLLKALKLDATKRGLRYQAISSAAVRTPGSWQRRLRTLAMFPRRAHVVRFISETAKPACLSVAEEWRRQGYACAVEDGEDGSVRLSVGPAEKPEFIYKVRPRAYAMPSFVMESEDSEERKYFRAEVHLREGGQDHDIMGWSKEEVIGDILDQYERHMHYLHLVG